ncbi:EndoU domain-containing protein [Pseudoalteromonas sp. 1_2015MBL_MicDiv]|uniref:EndoU domain-containing protein n=1 Tax=Pseudoalteromonas sp. 1_2015MBL_MicDiv TaxID=1720343 RepID=UPI0018E06F0C|nr:EndoU domain-containing protein [Pseudoalteromonas sp. 1_2015MBL_MicDiv]
MNISSNSIQVTESKHISELLAENMGEYHWAACTYIDGHENSNVIHDEEGIFKEESGQYSQLNGDKWDALTEEGDAEKRNFNERSGTESISDLERTNIDMNINASKAVANITAPIDFDGHILNAEVKRKGSRIQVVGGHSVCNGSIRVISGTKSVPNEHGVYKAEIEVLDPSNEGQYLAKTNGGGVSTMFPDSWTADRIKVEVDIAYKNKVIDGEMWTGTTPSGIKVKGWLEPKTTVYPLY